MEVMELAKFADVILNARNAKKTVVKPGGPVYIGPKIWKSGKRVV